MLTRLTGGEGVLINKGIVVSVAVVVVHLQIPLFIVPPPNAPFFFFSSNGFFFFERKKRNE